MKIAVVTGASSGLGVEFVRAIAEKYPALDEIWLLARRRERLEALAAEIHTPRLRPVPTDLGDTASLNAFSALLEQEKPEIRILINNAGYEHSGLFGSTSTQEITSMLRVNVLGLTLIQRLCLPYLGRGSFTVLTCSVSAFSPIPHQAVYSASKRYVYALGRALREELKPRGSNVLLLCPGNMNTEMNPKGAARQSSKIDHLPFLDMQRMTRESLRRAQAGQAVYTMGGVYKLYRLGCKVLPSGVTAKIAAQFF